MAGGRDQPPRWPVGPVDDGTSSEDTTVLPGLMETGNEDETSSGGFLDALARASNGDAPGEPADRESTYVEREVIVDAPAGGPPGEPADRESTYVERQVSVAPLARPTPVALPSLALAGMDFAASPVDEEAVPALFEPLPEMSPEIWQAGVRALVTVTDTIEPPWSDEEYWRELGALFVDEIALADDPSRRLELTLSAARVAERLGNGPMALRLVDDALEFAPDAPAAWRARGRLLEATGDLEGAHEAWRQMRAHAADAEERAFYTALDGEWTLARRGSLDGLEGPSLAAIPDGPARALAEAEIALLQGTPAEVAGALEQAAFGAGGPVGAALLEAAARFHEVGGDAATAAEQRFVAARMDAGTTAPPLGRLRDAARAAPDEIEPLLAELRVELGASALSHAVARWEAALARARGDLEAARQILASASARPSEASGAGGGREGAEGPAPSAALVRDRLDLDLEAGAPPDEEILARARAAATSPTATAAVALVEATGLASRGALAEALALLRDGLSLADDAVPLGLLAEDIARATDDADLRVGALEQWLRVDDARRAAAGLALAEAIDARGGAGAELAARAAWQTVIETAPGAAAFWTTAARDARAGRAADAAATLGYGAELWAGSKLGAPLAERAAELTALTSADAALAELQALATPGASELERLLTIARGAARAGASAERHAWLTDQVGVLTDVRTRAWWWIRRAQSLAPGAGDERLACLDAALEKVPSHPVALALLLGDPLATPTRIASALAAAAGSTDAAALRVAAIHTAALAGETQQASDLAGELLTAQPGPAAVDLALERARVAGGPAAAAALLAGLPPDAADHAQTLRLVEAYETVGQPARAIDLVGRLAGGPLAPDARRVAARLEAQSPGAGLPLEDFAAASDREAQSCDEALARLRRAAEQARLPEVVWALEHEPPHEAPPGADSLFSAALVEQGQGEGRGGRAPVLFEAAMKGGSPRLAVADHVAETAADAPAAAAFEHAAALAGAGGDVASVAPFLREAARHHGRAGDDAAADRCLRAAIAADGQHLPSVMALRRAAARRRDLAETVEACAFEAGVLRGERARVRALLRAAELARHDGNEDVPAENRHARALGLFRQVLEIEPENEAAFVGLRALLEENGAHAVLAEALGARIAVARNPFEITALRLARAELLAGPLLGDRRGAKHELETILQKEPQHARALSRLSDLEYDDGAFAAAGELYLRRAIVERAPDLLREVLMRLGRIYTRHVPDPKRAIGAYARVVQTEPDNHEALSALSDLYAETGATKNALAATEALLAHERDPARRLAALVRCGQLHERVGDLRQAGARFRQAADEAPRDYAAVSELARFLERTRDHAGRRALLDHAVGLLRHDVERGRFDLATLRALVPLLQARGKARAAAAGAQLLGAVADVEAEREAARGWAAPPPRGRRLAALSRPDVDERTFPPALLPGMRHVFRLVGPLLAKGGADLERHGLARGDRLSRGQAARDVVDGVATELGVPDVDVFVRKAGAPGPGGLRVEPGDRAAVILPAELPALGGHALRFAAARSLRLVATHLDLVLAATPAEAGALLGGVIRQFVPEFRHTGVRDDVLDGLTERVGKLLPRKLKPELMPFAVESAGAFDLEAVHAAVRDGANAVGLLACGDLPAALAAVLAGSGLTLAPADLARHPEALALLRFGLSDDYDDLAQAME